MTMLLSSINLLILKSLSDALFGGRNASLVFLGGSKGLAEGKRLGDEGEK